MKPKKKIVVGRKLGLILRFLFFFSAFIMGSILVDLFDGWKLAFSFIIVFVGMYIFCFKILPPICEKKSGDKLK